MTLFKYFLTLLLRSYKVVLMYLVIFMTIGFLMVQTNSSGSGVYQEKKVNFVLVDQDETEVSRHLTQYLEGLNSRQETPSTKEEIEEQLYLSVYEVVIIIPKGFSDNPEQNQIEINKNTLSEGYYKIAQDITGYIYMMQGSKNEKGDVNFTLLEDSLKQEIKVELTKQNSNNNGMQMWFFRFMNYTSYISIASIILVIGTVMSDFNNRKIALRNSCAGKSLQIFQSQMILGQLIYGFILSLFMIVPAILYLKGDYDNINLGLYWMNMMVLIFSVLCFTFMLNNVLDNKHALSGIANIYSLASSFLCGIFIPREFLGGISQQIGKFMPSYYFVSANESIYLQNEEWMNNMGIQILFSVAFLLIGFYVAKSKQSQRELKI